MPYQEKQNARCFCRAFLPLGLTLNFRFRSPPSMYLFVFTWWSFFFRLLFCSTQGPVSSLQTSCEFYQYLIHLGKLIIAHIFLNTEWSYFAYSLPLVSFNSNRNGGLCTDQVWHKVLSQVFLITKTALKNRTVCLGNRDTVLIVPLNMSLRSYFLPLKYFIADTRHSSWCWWTPSPALLRPLTTLRSVASGRSLSDRPPKWLSASSPLWWNTVTLGSSKSLTITEAARLSSTSLGGSTNAELSLQDSMSASEISKSGPTTCCLLGNSGKTIIKLSRVSLGFASLTADQFKWVTASPKIPHIDYNAVSKLQVHRDDHFRWHYGPRRGQAETPRWEDLGLLLLICVQRNLYETEEIKWKSHETSRGSPGIAPPAPHLNAYLAILRF